MQEKVNGTPGSEFQYVGTRPVRPGRRRQGHGAAPGSAPTSPCPASSSARCCAAPIRTRASGRSTPARPRSCPASRPSSPAWISRTSPPSFIPAGEMMINYKDAVRNVMAREKALYEGHAIAAVAATSAAVAKQALKLIKVDYEVLPHVIDVVEAMQPGAPLLHEDMYTAGVEPAPKTPSNVAKRVEFVLGDVAAGFKQADLIVEREFTTKPVHQGYIEPHACVASVSEDGLADVWVVDPGPLDRSRPLRAPARLGRRQGARDGSRDRRRLRRQDRRVSGADGAGAVAEGAPAREDGDVARGGVPLLRADVWRTRACQDRRQEGWAYRRGGSRAEIPGRRVRWLPGAARMHVRLRALRPRQRQGGRLRRGDEPAEGGGLSRARRAHLRVRGRERDRRDRRQDRHGPHRAAPQETRPRRAPRPPMGRSSARSA